MAEMQQKKSAFKERKAIPGLFGEERPQPHNLQAEQAVLGAMLKEPETCIGLVIEEFDSDEVFYSQVHREIFNTIRSLHDSAQNSCDAISVAHELNKREKLEEVGGEVFLYELTETLPTTANLENWCRIIKDLSTLRKMINACANSITQCYDPEMNVADLVDQIEQDIFQIRHSDTKTDIIDIKDGIIESFEYIQKVLRKEIQPAISTGYPDLDRLVTGFKPGEMFVLAARPSIGKTSFALNLLHKVALEQKVPVAFFSLEMTGEQLIRRMLCTEAKVSESSFYDNSFRPTDMQKITQAVQALSEMKFFIDPTPGITISELRSKARRLKQQHDIQLIAIDYLQIMHGSQSARQENRQQEVAEISGGIKQLAKELNVPILILAQLNREIEKGVGASAQPRLSHLRESGSIEQDADVVAFLHRDRDEAKDGANSEEINKHGVDTKLIIEKNRNGQTGYIDLRFRPSIMLFESKSRYGDDDAPPRLGS
jgi:replicative DNA helicase